MVGVTDFPFRKIVKDFGVGLVVSEMTASRAVIEALKNKTVRKRLNFFDASKEKSPVSMQIVGYDPEIMAEAAQFNEQLGASLIDINMGCPVKKVVNTDAGAALMRDEKLAEKIMRAVVKAVSIPVTVKMRLGWDFQHLNAVNLAKIAENEGICAVTIHGRTRSQFYEGKADWKAIYDVKKAVSIPIIGNGDVLTPEDAQQLLKESGAHAVMVGRGACGRPWFLQQISHFLDFGRKIEDPSSTVVYKTILKHIDLMMDFYGEYKGVRLARKHLNWYSKGKTGSADFRLAINATETSKKLNELIHQFFNC